MDKNRRDTLKKILEQDPSDSFSKYALGLEYISGGEHEKAIELFEELISADPNYLAAYYQLGRAYESCGDFEPAKKIFEKGLYVAASQNDYHTKEELEQALENLL
jgi:tetratricopeptide (TPR) repeat protein